MHQRSLTQEDLQTIQGAAVLWLDFKAIIDDLRFLGESEDGVPNKIVYAVDNDVCNSFVDDTTKRLGSILHYPGLKIETSDDVTPKLTLAKATLNEIFFGSYSDHIGFVRPQLQEVLAAIRYWSSAVLRETNSNNLEVKTLLSRLPKNIRSIITGKQKSQLTHELVEKVFFEIQTHGPELLRIMLMKSEPYLGRVNSLVDHVAAGRLQDIADSLPEDTASEKQLKFCTEEFWYPKIVRRSPDEKKRINNYLDAASIAKVYEMNMNAENNNIGVRVLLLTTSKGLLESANSRCFPSKKTALPNYIRTPQQLSELFQLSAALGDGRKNPNSILDGFKEIHNQLDNLFYALRRQIPGVEENLSHDRFVWLMSIESRQVRQMVGKKAKNLIANLDELEFNNQFVGVLTGMLTRARALWNERIDLSFLVLGTQQEEQVDREIRELKSLLESENVVEEIGNRRDEITNQLAKSHNYLAVFAEKTFPNHAAIGAISSILNTRADIKEMNSDWKRKPPYLRSPSEDRTKRYAKSILRVFHASDLAEEAVAVKGLIDIVDATDQTELGVLSLTNAYILGSGYQWHAARRECRLAIKYSRSSESWSGLSAYFYMAQILRHQASNSRRDDFVKALAFLDTATNLAMEEVHKDRLIQRIECERMAQVVSYYEYYMLLGPGSKGIDEQKLNKIGLSLSSTIDWIGQNMEDMLANNDQSDYELRLKTQFFTYVCDIYLYWSTLGIGYGAVVEFDSKVAADAYAGLEKVIGDRGGFDKVSYMVKLIKVLGSAFIPQEPRAIDAVIGRLNWLQGMGNAAHRHFEIWPADKRKIRLTLDRLYALRS